MNFFQDGVSETICKRTEELLTSYLPTVLCARDKGGILIIWCSQNSKTPGLSHV